MKTEINIEVKITKENLQELYYNLCIKPNTTDIVDAWCQDCPLGKIEYNAGIDCVIMRPLCFAIWHDGILK